MLLTVREVASILDMDFHNVYYLIESCKVDGVKIRDDWRVYSDSVRELYDKRENDSIYRDRVCGGNGFSGFDELVERIRANRVQNHRRRRYSRVERRRRVELSARRRDKVSRKTRKCVESDPFDIWQLEFDFGD